MKVLEKLLDYVSYETTSDPSSDVCPSSPKELVLGNHLVNELLKYGCDEAFIDEHGYVYGTLNGDTNYASFGLVAHMDTTDDASGKNIKPRIIENYDGESIKLSNGLVTDTTKFPNLNKYKGKTIVVTDGNTLLGADDKAGVAIIMEVIETLANNKELKHGTIKVCITPDEEIGRGADLFNYDIFKVDYCYTVDGSDISSIENENFNAAHVDVEISGISVHPGDAKGRLVNSILLAHKFHELIDDTKRPETTEGYEGYIHLGDMDGRVDESNLHYILRSFDLTELEKFKSYFIKARDYINDYVGFGACIVDIKDDYRNMKEAFNGDTKTIDLFYDSCKELGIEPRSEAIRGGTDGARMSLEGLPTPNLGTGGDYFHGPHELWCKDDGEMMVNIILKMISKINK